MLGTSMDLDQRIMLDTMLAVQLQPPILRDSWDQHPQDQTTLVTIQVQYFMLVLIWVLEVQSGSEETMLLVMNHLQLYHILDIMLV